VYARTGGRFPTVLRIGQPKNQKDGSSFPSKAIQSGPLGSLPLLPVQEQEPPPLLTGGGRGLWPMASLRALRESWEVTSGKGAGTCTHHTKIKPFFDLTNGINTVDTGF
jgi:hypothetical protein